MIPVCRPCVGDEEIEAVTRVIRSGWLSTGKETELFEKELSEYLNIPYVVCVSSASMGLKLALLAHGITKYGRVLTTPMTFVATANAIRDIGATPIFTDILDKNGLFDPVTVDKKFSGGDFDAILPVDLYGQSVDIDALCDIANNHRVPLILDAAQSLGRTGKFPVTSVFSFYVTKNITTGEGGAVATHRKEIAERIRTLSNQGQTVTTHARYHGDLKKYDVIQVGYKGNMPDIAAAMGRVQLKKIDALTQKRKELFEAYNAVVKSTVPTPGNTNYHLYTIQSLERDLLQRKFNDLGIGTAIHYPFIGSFSAYSWVNNLPAAKRWGEQTLTLPTNSDMTHEELETIVSAIKEVGC